MNLLVAPGGRADIMMGMMEALRRKQLLQISMILQPAC